LWDFLIINPLSQLLLFLYNLVHNYGVAIILFGLITKLILLYFSARGKQGMMRQQRLAPKQKELEKMYGKDKAKYNEKLMELYKTEGVSPMSGCLWSLLPLPIFFALFAVVRQPLTNLMKLTGSDIDAITEILPVSISNQFYVEMELGQKIYENFDMLQGALPVETAEKLIRLNFEFFPGLSLAPVPNLPWSGGWNWLIVIPLLSCATSFLISFISQRLNGAMQAQGQQAGMMKGMMYIMPLFSLWIGFTTPAAMGVYWTANNLFQVVQEYQLTRYYKKKFDEEDARKADLAARRKAAEDLMREEERQKRIEMGETGNKNTSKKKQYRLKNSPKPKEADPTQEESQEEKD
jgi:YidC/Oxa1 family membrane protein insertase